MLFFRIAVQKGVLSDSEEVTRFVQAVKGAYVALDLGPRFTGRYEVVIAEDLGEVTRKGPDEERIREEVVARIDITAIEGWLTAEISEKLKKLPSELAALRKNWLRQCKIDQRIEVIIHKSGPQPPAPPPLYAFSTVGGGYGADGLPARDLAAS